ncbi:MAG TPA: helix-turn-helix domain-containing protein [Noviherbaspirillum sp.]|nr:helix-turn-helix domain-containing protein [Noviherbaspirillum sp.]
MDPTSGRRERKRQQTLDLLVDTAFELFEAHGYESVTMEQIAAAADLAKGTLYNHFPVKEALLRHYFHRQFAEQGPALREKLRRQPDTIKRIALLLKHAAAWAEEHRRYMPHYLQYRLGKSIMPDAGDERSGTDAVFAVLIADAQEANRLRRELDTGKLVHYFRYLYLAAFTRWLNEPDVKLVDELMAMLDLFVTGAGTGESQ